MRVGSLTFRMALFFAANPDETLTSRDIGVKFNVGGAEIGPTLKYPVGLGWFKREQVRSRGPLNIYSAGPELLRAIGKKA